MAKDVALTIIRPANGGYEAFEKRRQDFPFEMESVPKGTMFSIPKMVEIKTAEPIDHKVFVSLTDSGWLVIKHILPLGDANDTQE